MNREPGLSKRPPLPSPLLPRRRGRPVSRWAIGWQRVLPSRWRLFPNDLPPHATSIPLSPAEGERAGRGVRGFEGSRVTMRESVRRVLTRPEGHPPHEPQYATQPLTPSLPMNLPSVKRSNLLCHSMLRRMAIFDHLPSRFRGSKREILFGGILSPSDGEREGVRGGSWRGGIAVGY